MVVITASYRIIAEEAKHNIIPQQDGCVSQKYYNGGHMPLFWHRTAVSSVQDCLCSRPMAMKTHMKTLIDVTDFRTDEFDR